MLNKLKVVRSPARVTWWVVLEGKENFPILIEKTRALATQEAQMLARKNGMQVC